MSRVPGGLAGDLSAIFCGGHQRLP